MSGGVRHHWVGARLGLFALSGVGCSSAQSHHAVDGGVDAASDDPEVPAWVGGGLIPQHDSGDALPEDTGDISSPLRGQGLEPPVSLPVFEARGLDGEIRSPEWFVGDPSVIWFFRDTGST